MAAPTILAFNLDAHATALRGVCDALGLRLKIVPEAGFAMPIGGMVGIPVRAAAIDGAAESFDDPMLVMCGLGEADLDAFLRAIRQSPLPPIPLKAVLTPYNAGWSALALRRELARERAEMLKRMRKSP